MFPKKCVHIVGLKRPLGKHFALVVGYLVGIPFFFSKFHLEGWKNKNLHCRNVSDPYQSQVKERVLIQVRL